MKSTYTTTHNTPDEARKAMQRIAQDLLQMKNTLEKLGCVVEIETTITYSVQVSQDVVGVDSIIAQYLHKHDGTFQSEAPLHPVE